MTAKIKLNAASGGGSFSLQAPSSSSNNRVISLPDIADGTLVTSQSTLDATKLSGNLPAISGASLTGIQQLKAWINYDGYGNSIRASYNIASVTDNGTGDYTFIIDTDFSDVNYCWTGTSTTATGTETVVRVTGFSTASSSTSNNAHLVGSTRVSVAEPSSNNLLDARQVMIQWIR
jgi:hypothetical protein